MLAPIFKKVFDAAGVPEPEIKVQNADGHPALCQVLRHRYGDSPALFVGFLERDGLPVDGKPRQVTLPGEFHVYDLLKGGLVKAGSSFEFTPIPGLGNLYAALPYAVQGLEAACPAKAKVGESLPFTLTVAVSGGKPGYHVLRRVVVNPEGKEEPCYSANLEAPDGVCTGRLDLALNAMPGRWTLKARDVLTGNETQRSFEVAR